MKSRESLLRTRKFEVEDKQQTVAQLDAMIADFKRLADDLTAQIEDEQNRAGVSDVHHFNYPPFAKAALQRRDNLQISIDDLDEKLAIAKDELRIALEDLKSVEVIERKEQEDANKAILMNEQRNLDEMAQKRSAE